MRVFIILGQLQSLPLRSCCKHTPLAFHSLQGSIDGKHGVVGVDGVSEEQAGCLSVLPRSRKLQVAGSRLRDRSDFQTCLKKVLCWRFCVILLLNKMLLWLIFPHGAWCIQNPFKIYVDWKVTIFYCLIFWTKFWILREITWLELRGNSSVTVGHFTVIFLILF